MRAQLFVLAASKAASLHLHLATRPATATLMCKNGGTHCRPRMGDDLSKMIFQHPRYQFQHVSSIFEDSIRMVKWDNLPTSLFIIVNPLLQMVDDNPFIIMMTTIPSYPSSFNWSCCRTIPSFKKSLRRRALALAANQWTSKCIRCVRAPNWGDTGVSSRRTRCQCSILTWYDDV